MLTRTFTHIPGVGYVTEWRLWSAGVGSWSQALGMPHAPPGFSDERWDLLCATLENSMASLGAGDHQYFAHLLRARDHWRALPEFRQRIAYLDIETTGLNHWDSVTVVGVYDGVRTHTYVAGDNLDEFPEAIARYSLLVTFNGATFDLPFLLRRFGDIFDQLHIDLRYALGRLGHHGGLKAIEQKLGLQRGEAIADISGDDAVRLWYEYLRGSPEALELLIAYNRADVENLEALAELAYQKLWERTQSGPPGADR